MLEARMQSDGACHVVATVALVLLVVAGCHRPESGPVAPADSVPMPARGFYMGVLPIPAEGQSFDSVYAQAARYCEFAPVWEDQAPSMTLPTTCRAIGGRPSSKTC
jgi:hypothetical protein